MFDFCCGVGAFHHDDYRICDSSVSEDWITFIKCNINLLFYNEGDSQEENSNYCSATCQVFRSGGNYLARNIITIEKALSDSSSRLGQSREALPTEFILRLLNECESVGYVATDVLLWILSTYGSDANICQICTSIIIVGLSNLKDISLLDHEKQMHERISAVSYILGKYEYCAKYIVQLLNQDQETVVNVLQAVQFSLGKHCL